MNLFKHQANRLMQFYDLSFVTRHDNPDEDCIFIIAGIEITFSHNGRLADHTQIRKHLGL